MERTSGIKFVKLENPLIPEKSLLHTLRTSGFQFGIVIKTTAIINSVGTTNTTNTTTSTTITSTTITATTTLVGLVIRMSDY